MNRKPLSTKVIILLAGFIGVFAGSILLYFLIKYNVFPISRTIGTENDGVIQDQQVGLEENKKSSLEQFYKSLTQAESERNFEELYKLTNPVDKKWYSYQDMVLTYGNKEYFSVEYIVHTVKVESNMGFIDRTLVKCLSETCLDADKEVQRDTRSYEYIDGMWYLEARKPPSDRARQLAAYMYANSSDEKKRELANRYNNGVDDNLQIIRVWSIILENNPELMAYDEALVEKHKSASSKPNVYVESPDIVQQPVIQQPRLDNINCTSNSIGNYTYTNCY